MPQASREVVVNVVRRAVHEQNNCESEADNPIGVASRSRIVTPKGVGAVSEGESEAAIVVRTHTKGLRARFLSLRVCFFIVKL